MRGIFSIESDWLERNVLFSGHFSLKFVVVGLLFFSDSFLAWMEAMRSRFNQGKVLFHVIPPDPREAAAAVNNNLP